MDEVPWGAHLCVFYQSTDDLFDAASGYFEAGLDANEFCVWLLPDAVSREIGRAKFDARLDDTERLIKAGRLELLTSADVGPFDPHRRPEFWSAKIDQALASGYEGLRGAGDVSAAGGDRAVVQQYEDNLRRLLSDKPVLALCTYQLETALAADVFNVVRDHNVTVARRDGRWEFMETPELERANAQIHSVDDALAALSRAFPDKGQLTERERMVLAFLVKGDSSKEAARDLGISPRTVDFHRANIIEKLGARNTADVIRRVLGGG